MGMNPKIAIVVLNWNGLEDTLDCLTSLDRFGYDGLNRIVVDNGSDDGSAELVARRYPGITLIRLPENRGFTGGINTGIKRALADGADFICLLNNDTVVTAGFLEKLLEAAAKNPRAGVLAPRVNYARDPELVWSQGIAVNRLTGRILTPHCGRPVAKAPGRVEDVSAVSGAVMLVPRETFETVGLFDERYFLCFEDVDFCLRVRRTGKQVLVVPQSLVYHKVSVSMGGEGSSAIIYYSTRNQLRALNTRLPMPWFWRPQRNLFIMGYTLFFTLITSRTPLGEGLRTWGRGLSDYFRGVGGMKSR